MMLRERLAEELRIALICVCVIELTLMELNLFMFFKIMAVSMVTAALGGLFTNILRIKNPYSSH